MPFSLADVVEAVGVVLVLVGLALWLSAPVGVVAAGLVLVAAANVPAGRPDPTRRDGQRTPPRR